ncbi:MAG: hypothetical protein P4L35_19040 [Ignavibacteriaceae bacterium]|nr:hypothetical protein [Ignavibacteriaceae bacterium]
MNPTLGNNLVFDTYDKGEWKSTKDLEKKKNEYQQIAKKTTAKNKSKKPK